MRYFYSNNFTAKCPFPQCGCSTKTAALEEWDTVIKHCASIRQQLFPQKYWTRTRYSLRNAPINAEIVCSAGFKEYKKTSKNLG